MAIKRKWEDAIHFSPDKLKEFWSNRLKDKRDILIITGMGWDPRMPALPDFIKELGGAGLRSVHLIRYSPSPTFESPHKFLIERNIESLHKIASNWAEIIQVDIITRKEDGLYIGDEEISKYYINYDIRQFNDIIIDVSSLPKSLYFTLLLILTKKSMKHKQQTNIHVVACQVVDLDNQITETADDTRRLKGFKGVDTRFSQQGITVVWAPILANNDLVSLKKLHDDIAPMDIYPILPFPSRNPRSDDNLLVEYRELFIDQWRLNPLNFIYAAEDDPLDVYQSLLNLFQQQEEALRPLGSLAMVVSVLSSKLSSIGAFMAAFEKNMAIEHAIGRHNPPPSINLDSWDMHHRKKFKENIHAVWLTGEPYV